MFSVRTRFWETWNRVIACAGLPLSSGNPWFNGPADAEDVAKEVDRLCGVREAAEMSPDDDPVEQ